MPMSRRERARDDKGKPDLAWWAGKDRGKKIWDLGERISRQNNYRRAQDLFFACLYDDSELAALIQGSSAVSSFTPQTMTTNIVKRQLDAYVAAMSESRPLPMALTSGGTYSQQRRAKATSKFFEGALDHVGYYKTRPLRIRDSAMFGSGFAYNYRIGRRIYHCRKYPWEIMTDRRDAEHGAPMGLWMNEYTDRLVAEDLYPKKGEIVRSSNSKDSNDRWDTDADDCSDRVLIKKCWRLRSFEGSKRSGAAGVAVSDGLIDLSEYDPNYFPISKLDFSPPVIGWRGEGMVKDLAGLQFEVNAIGLRLQEQGHLTGSYVLLEDGSGIETDTLDNGALTVVRYRGIKPDWQTPPPWHPAFFDYYMKLRGQFASDVTGQSEMAVRGEKPGGLDSGKALRVHKDILSGNFVTQGRLDEEDCIDTAWQLFDLMEEIEFDPDIDDEGSYEVKYQTSERGKTMLKKTDYKSVRIARDELELKVFPTSFLSSTPEDKWSQVAEMAKADLFSEDELLTLLDFPDVERVLNLRNAGRRVIESIVEKFLDGEPPAITPEPTMNLDLAVVIGTLAYLEAKWLDGAPEKNTSALLQFVIAAEVLRKKKVTEEAALAGGQLPAEGEPLADQPPEGLEASALPPAAGSVGPEELYAPPEGQPLPANAVAPEALPQPALS